MLALLCINVCRMTDPQVIIFAGGMAGAGEKLLSRVRRYIASRAWTCLPQDTPLVVARAHNAGSVGAGMAAYRMSLTAPAVAAVKNNVVDDKNGHSGFNAKICVVTGLFTLLLWKAKPSGAGASKCPIFGGAAIASLASISLFSGFSAWAAQGFAMC